VNDGVRVGVFAAPAALWANVGLFDAHRRLVRVVQAFHELVPQRRSLDPLWISSQGIPGARRHIRVWHPRVSYAETRALVVIRVVPEHTNDVVVPVSWFGNAMAHMYRSALAVERRRTCLKKASWQNN